MSLSKIISRKKFINKSLLGGVMTAFASFMVGCNQDWPNLLTTEYPAQTGPHKGKNNRVLLITIDGVSGTALSSMADSKIPTITTLKRNSLYSLRSLADYEDVDLDYPISYANLFTGVSFSKHNFNGVPEESNLGDYPSFIKRIKTENPNTTIGVFSGNESAVSSLAAEADVKNFGIQDSEVIEKATAYLKSEHPEVVVVNLVDADKVGQEVGYSTENAAYAEAIVDVDTKIKTIKTALESRETYKEENWLVIITSTQGANAENGTLGSTAYDDLRKNTFTLFYNPKFNSSPIAIPNTGSIPFSSTSPVYNGSLASNNTALIPDDGGLYNFGTNDFTIRFTMKGSGVERTWPVFLSKGGRIDDSNPGWRLYISRKLLSMQVGGNGGWSNWGTDLVVNDGLWHNVAIVFFKEDGVRKVKAFVDGVKSERVENINGRPGLTTNEPIRVGRNRDDADLPDVQISHLQIYDRAWSDQDVQDNSCKVEVDESSLHYENLVGYWPSNESKERILYNKAPRGEGKDLVLQGSSNWQSFSDISEKLCPMVNKGFYQLVPNLVDIPYTIYNWMSIPVRGTWNLDGKVWSFNFNNIKP